jgi:hypothetical protein
MCNGMSMRQYKEKIRLNIARHGWHAQLVEGGRDSPAFGYTIGLTELKHAEFFISGLPPEEIHRMLAELAHRVVGHDDRLLASMTMDLSNRRVYLAPIEEPELLLLYGIKLYRHRLRAVQAVWADDSGQLPWEQEHPDMLTQRVYGTPPGLTPVLE